MSRRVYTTTFTQEIGETICEGLAEGHSLLEICEAMGIPYSTARGWELDIPEHAANATDRKSVV